MLSSPRLTQANQRGGATADAAAGSFVDEQVAARPPPSRRRRRRHQPARRPNALTDGDGERPTRSQKVQWVMYEADDTYRDSENYQNLATINNHSASIEGMRAAHPFVS